MSISRIYSFIVRQALVAAVFNGLINGWKAWATFKAGGTFSLTLDSIGAGSSTVFGQAVAGAFILGMIATVITFLTFRSAAAKQQILLRPNLRFWPNFVFLMLRHAVFAFGVLSILAILLQRWVGTIEVGHSAASLITGAISFSVSLSTSASTMLSMIDDSNGTRLA